MNLRRTLISIAVLTLTALLGTAPLQAQTFGTSTPVSTGTNPRSIAVTDVDNDGDLDFLSANQTTNDVSVRLNTGAGVFTGSLTASVGNSPDNLTTGDVNGDGKTDLLTASNVGAVSVRFGAGDGTFGGGSEISTGGDAYDVALGDLDGDGDLDFLATNRLANTVSIRLNDGTGAFTGSAFISLSAPPLDIVIADFNRDGKPDFLTGYDTGTTVTLHFGNGDGTFGTVNTIPVDADPRRIATGDLNNDGFLDFITGNNASAGNISVRLGTGTATFTSATTVGIIADLRDIALSDVNLDGKLDLCWSKSGSMNAVDVALGDGAGNFSGGVSVPVGANPFDIALADVSSDGKPDILTVNFADATGSVALNTTPVAPTLTFITAAPVPVGTAPFNVITGDFNRDGRLDVAASDNGSTFLSTRLGNGAGGFPGANSIGVGNSPSVSAGDYDRDGAIDLFSANFADGTVSICRGNGDGTFNTVGTVSTGANPARAALADFNRDGDLDFTVPVGNTIICFLGDGTGIFTAQPAEFVGNNPYWIEAGDFNNDGKPDIAVANILADNVSVRLGTGSGTFGAGSEVTTGSGCSEVALGDINKDGKLDFISANGIAGTASVRFGVGNGTFTGITNLAIGGQPTGVILFDFDRDGDLDVAVTDLTNDLLAIRLNDGAGNFSGSLNVSTGDQPFNPAAGDFNGDGILDIAVANKGSNNFSVLLGSIVPPVITVTNALNAGAGSLRQAVADIPAGGVIKFAPALTGSTITLTTGTLVLNKNLTIEGLGAGSISVSGNNAARVFQINAGQTVSISGITVRNGRTPDSQGGAGIRNLGTLTLRSSVVSDCQSGVNTVEPGAGILNGAGGTATIINCDIRNNFSAVNFASKGAGMQNDGVATLQGCTFRGNNSLFARGAGFNNDGTATATNCTFSGNISQSNGTGVHNNAGTLTLTNCTATANNSGATGAGVYRQAGTFNLRNTLVSANIGSGFADVGGAFASQGYNLIGNTTGGSGFVGTDLLNAAAIPLNLGMLADNGGETFTHALLSGSVALDAGDPATTGIETDQRGLSRIVDGNATAGARIDIGAFEAPRFVTTWFSATLTPSTNQPFNSVATNTLGTFAAVGDSGIVYVSTDGGSSWQRYLPNYPALGLGADTLRLRAIAIADNFSAARYGSTQTGNSAAGQRRVNASSVQSSSVQTPAAFGTAISCGGGGTILRTEDGGITWTNQTPNYTALGLTAASLNSIALSNTFAAEAQGAKGKSGTQSPAAFGTAISCGVGGTILRTEDGGTTWQNITPNYAALGTPAVTLQSVAVANSFSAARHGSTQTGNSAQTPAAFGTAISCGVGGTILRTTDGGTTWTAAISNTDSTLNAVALVGDGTVQSKRPVQSPAAFGTAISCGVGGTILRSTDGLNWENISANIQTALAQARAKRAAQGMSAVSADFNAVAGASESVYFVAGDGGMIFKTTDFGNTWENLSTGTASLSAIALQLSGQAVIAGENATLLSSLNGGGGDNPLPVELLNFTGQLVPPASSPNASLAVQLTWTTASESDNAGFSILRDGSPIAGYETDASLTGQGTKTGASAYAFSDASVETGNTYAYTLRSQDFSGRVYDYPQTVTVEVKTGNGAAPKEYVLYQNYPNPFNPATTIRYALKESGLVRLELYNTLGQKVRELVNEVQPAGEYQQTVNLVNLSSGAYFYRLTATGSAGNFSQIKTLFLIK